MSEYTGVCYRHRLRFIPSPQFDNTCPACWHESQRVKEKADKEKPKKDKNVLIENIGRGRFRTVDD